MKQIKLKNENKHIIRYPVECPIRRENEIGVFCNLDIECDIGFTFPKDCPLEDAE